ncbi:hypothetical protein [Bosea sp. ANAM02]|uniref:helix-turn-helix transcriptional regulator n=1 Tax=Bosea sp. ANAM02 TaxID=2020412 RepID=UPI00140EDC40|nr:hypothetical protein [Bosea sp. ANAM02]BCB21810.1 hypothetical protein OCUBac02_47040 [Bosea sp. ANAM02]
MEDVNRLIHAIYEASLDQDHWSEVLTTLAEIVGGCHTHLVLADLRTDTQYVNVLLRSDPAGAEEYLRDYAATDFRAPRVLPAQPGLMRDERSYVSAEDARTSIIHNEFLPRFGIHNIAGANMRVDDCFGWFGISTPRRDTPFSERQMSLLQLIAPHIHRALRIAKSQRDLALAGQRARDAQDIVDVGIVVFQDGEAVSTNAAAEAIFCEGFLYLQQGRLACSNRAQAAAIERLAQGDDIDALTIRDARGGRSYLLRRHAPSGRAVGSARGFVLSVMRSEARSPVSLADVREFCGGSGITPAEAQAIHASLTDTGLAALAETRRVNLDTVRKQLKSALAKLDVGSQRQLHRMFERYRMVGDAPAIHARHSLVGE